MTISLSSAATAKNLEEAHGQGWIGVDLDGTLAHYDGWKGASHIGEPIPAMVSRVRIWIQEGKDVRIFTGRVTEGKGDEHECRAAIQDWLRAQGLPHLPVTNVKDHFMLELWDDRSIQVVPNTGMTVHEYLEFIQAMQIQ